MTATTETTTAAARPGPRRSLSWPAVHPLAWHGPLGQAVCRIAPTTEADPIAVLVQALALFGAMCGDGPHVRIGGVSHPARIWPLVVGKTSAGRKGTAMAEARRLGRSWGDYARRYLAARELSGLASGEGLLHALGAAQTAGKGNGGEDPDREAQAPDGRLFVVETEFARTLAAAKRDGATLGPILRQMWDSGSAQIMTKASPLKVDGAHVGLAAHITPRELRIRLNEADVVGGTLNRFLIVGSERPHLLPDEPDHPDLSDVGEDLGRALEHARDAFGSRRLHRDREAAALWPEVYAALNADDPDGQLGAVLARGPAYTMRLALAFALTTSSTSITKPHLLAGLAVWHYSVLTARKLFSDTRSLSDEQRLLEFIAAGPDGRTKSAINDWFGGHRRTDEIDTVIDHLEQAKLVTTHREDSTGGRPAKRYRVTDAGRDPIARILDAYW